MILLRIHGRHYQMSMRLKRALDMVRFGLGPRCSFGEVLEDLTRAESFSVAAESGHLEFLNELRLKRQIRLLYVLQDLLARESA